jgi:hypothetical protein
MITSNPKKLSKSFTFVRALFVLTMSLELSLRILAHMFLEKKMPSKTHNWKIREHITEKGPLRS